MALVHATSTRLVCGRCQEVNEPFLQLTWEFPKIRRYLILGVLIVRILLFGVLYWGPLFSEPPTLLVNQRPEVHILGHFAAKVVLLKRSVGIRPT